MPLSEDDERRLPPIILPEEVARKQKQDEIKAFRKYLVDTGTVKCLTKMYKHVYKNEMRLDNPKAVTEFLESFQKAAAEEVESAVQENEALRERNDDLAAQFRALTETVESMATERAGFSPDQLFSELVALSFWEAVEGVPAPSGDAVTLKQLFRRLCGGSEHVALLAPAALEEVGDFPLTRDAFRLWVARDLSATERAWSQDILLPRLAEAAGTAPFEEELKEAVIESGLFPDRSDEVAGAVGFGDVGLRTFVEAAAAYCAGLSARRCQRSETGEPPGLT